MFTVKERCELKPLARQGPFARPFFVDVSVNLLNPKKADVSLSLLDEDGTEKKLAVGVYEAKPELLQRLKKEAGGQT